MPCGVRVAGALLAALCLTALSLSPVSAQTIEAGWRPPVESRFTAFEAEMAPVLVRAREMDSMLPEAVTVLGQASSGLDLTTVTRQAAVVSDAFRDLTGIAVDGLAVLDAFPPEPCWIDYAAVLRTGYLLLGDAAADPSQGGPRFNQGMNLILVYGELVRSVVDCS